LRLRQGPRNATAGVWPRGCSFAPDFALFSGPVRRRLESKLGWSRRHGARMPKRRRAREPIPPDASPLGRALDALALTRREGLSLRAASDLARTDPRTVRRYAGQALRKRGGRWRPTAYDRIP